MLDPRWYEGREQALVKHTFLDTYMPAQIPKIVSWANEFTYVDLFAGPWQSQSGDYADTSFGIALRCMTEAKAVQAKLGRTVKMVAHLVEKDPDNFAELTEAVKRFPEVETHCYRGVAEAHAKTIADRISMRAFRFVVIDPKGIPDVRAFKCLIEPGNTEVLLNFMFQFANRFASSQDRMPPLEGWLGGLSDEGGSWRKDFAALKGAEREAAGAAQDGQLCLCACAHRRRDRRRAPALQAHLSLAPSDWVTRVPRRACQSLRSASDLQVRQAPGNAAAEDRHGRFLRKSDRDQSGRA